MAKRVTELEEDLERILHLPLVTGTARVCAEVRSGQNVDEPGGVEVVEHVIDFPAELEVHPLRDLGVFEEPSIVVREVRQTQEVARARAKIAKQRLRQRKVAGIQARCAGWRGSRLIADPSRARARNRIRSGAALRRRTDKSRVAVGANGIGDVALQGDVINSLFCTSKNTGWETGLEREDATYGPAM